MSKYRDGAPASQTGLSPTVEPASSLAGSAASIPSAEPLNLNGYYIGFDKTGVFEIDLILSAVARSGKAYHHTEDWHEETPAYDPRFRGTCPLEWIQNAANDAAKAIEARQLPQSQALEPPPSQQGAD